jgi:hypothetical protein
MKESLQIPVLFITFNRPDVSKVVLDRILEVNPPKIYFFNDAPRPGNENDRIKCAEVRDLAKNLNYKGELITRFEEKNLGCKGGESTSMGWLFENEEMGIVIEDDILPTIDFFFYCQDMLHKYRYDDRIFSITGCNLINEWKSEEQDYHFTNYPSFWGWAGWQRVWKKYDVTMNGWNDPKIRELVLQYLPTKEFRELRTSEFDSLVSGQNDTWDYQFYFLHHINHALAVCPSKNMIENIGIDHVEAVHMIGDSPFSDLKSSPSNLPMKDNPIMVPDYEYAVKSIKKGYAYFYEIPVYPEPPKPNTKQKISMAIGKMIGKKGLLRDLTNLILGRK